MIKVTVCNLTLSPTTFLINPENFTFYEADGKQKEESVGCESVIINNYSELEKGFFIKETIEEVIALIGRSGNSVRSTQAF